jgi:hypothetical protein
MQYKRHYKFEKNGKLVLLNPEDWGQRERIFTIENYKNVTSNTYELFFQRKRNP